MEKSTRHFCENLKQTTSTQWFRSNCTKGMEILSIYDIPFAIYSAKNVSFFVLKLQGERERGSEREYTVRRDQQGNATSRPRKKRSSAQMETSELLKFLQQPMQHEDPD